MPLFRQVSIASALLLLPLAASADARDQVVGRWATATSILDISHSGGALSARVFAMLEPTYNPDEEFGPAGAARRDDNNPNESLRGRPLQNLELLSDYTFNGKRWEGKLYDPESGNTYSSRMELDRDGNLKMRGFIGISLLGRTEVLQPLSQCTETMQQMLQNSNVAEQAPECRKR